MSGIPVIALTGFLGAGKTTLLNHLLSTPGARIGVVINDFGAINVDAQLVTGQIDEPVSVAGGCICCMPEDGRLDLALTKLADPRLALDAIIVEASGVADPVAIARIIGFSGVNRIRSGGVIDVVDAATHFDTVDRGTLPPARYGAATLVVVNKLDLLPEPARESTLERLRDRIRASNPRAQVVPATHGRIDPALIFDTSGTPEETGQLSFRDLFLEAAERPAAQHVHADAVTVTSTGPVDPAALLDLLEEPPAGVYRLKGTVALADHGRARKCTVHVVGTSVAVTSAPRKAEGNVLVAIGLHLNTESARGRIEQALRPATDAPSEQGLRRLRRYLGVG